MVVSPEATVVTTTVQSSDTPEVDQVYKEYERCHDYAPHCCEGNADSIQAELSAFHVCLQ